jgi:nitrate reductase NapAB chaperone NapD
MIVAGVVIETTPGAAPRVAARLLRFEALELQGGDGDRRLAAVFTGEDARALEALAERLVRDDPEVLGVFPTYVADEEDPADARASATESLRARERRGGDRH